MDTKTKGISIIVPTWNEEKNIKPLTERISAALTKNNIPYEVIFIEDNSSDKTKEVIKALSAKYPISLYMKVGKKGKAQSLIEGFSHAKYPVLCMIDADLQYPPENIPAMYNKVCYETGTTDIVVGNRAQYHKDFLRKTASYVFRTFFGQYLHNLNCDVQSGLKVFKKEIVQRIRLNSSTWDFDLEFLVRARNAGYKIESMDIDFNKRDHGESKVNLLSASANIAFSALKLKVRSPDIVPFLPEYEATRGKGFHYRGVEFVHHSDLHHSESAIHRFSTSQKVMLLTLVFIFTVLLTANWHLTLVVFIALLTILYFVDLMFNFFLIYRSFSKPEEIVVTAQEMSKISETEWPTYTILCPLYKEWQVLPQLVTAMSNLEYPKNKLQIMLLLEEKDKETIAKVAEYDLPDFFDVVVVPDSQPKTKPKACNYGLPRATGEYTVIYDAEDIPDTKQLKKAVLAFKKVPSNVACIQSKLNFYNPHQNILTRVFTAEYSLWFDLILTGLQSIHAPIPLGGTSNHFRTKDLKELKGWDAFNVTEDCDLGIRLVKRGLKTAILDSTTLEEANSNLRNWFWQRTRWVKGYIQSYLVHMRKPKEFMRDWKEPHVVTFQLVVGGKVLSMFINPLMWLITISYFVFRAQIGTFIEQFYPTPILYMATFCIVFGNFLYVYYYMIGCAKREYYDIIKYVFLVPLYWLGMSMAAWVAVYQFIKAPHYWQKTLHGLHLNKEGTAIPAAVPTK